MRCGLRSKDAIYSGRNCFLVCGLPSSEETGWGFLGNMAGSGGERKRLPHLPNLQGGEVLDGMCGALRCCSEVVFWVALTLMKGADYAPV